LSKRLKAVIHSKAARAYNKSHLYVGTSKTWQKSNEKVVKNPQLCCLEYNPRQPQYSPTYDLDPFYNEKGYNPLYSGYND
jgi:hypothetical protein